MWHPDLDRGGSFSSAARRQGAQARLHAALHRVLVSAQMVLLPQGVRHGAGEYNAFLSYAWDPADAQGSDVSDAAVARRLRYAMQDLGKPRTRRSDLEIFLDRSVQTPSPDLWRGILDNLDRSRFLIVLCSPRAAASDGVAREVQHWLDTGRSINDLLVVLLDGSPDEALPAPLRRLRDAGTYDPLFVDLRWVASARDLDSRTSSRFREDVATLLAPIRGVAKQTLRRRGAHHPGAQHPGAAPLHRRAVDGGRPRARARPGRNPPMAAGRRPGSDRRVPCPRRGAANQLATGLDVAQLLAVEGFRRDDNLETRATLLARHARQLAAWCATSTRHAGRRPDGLDQPEHRGRGHGSRTDAPARAVGQRTGTRSDRAPRTGRGGRHQRRRRPRRHHRRNAVLVWRLTSRASRFPWRRRTRSTALGLSPGGRWLVVALREPTAFGKGVLAVVDRTGACPAATSRSVCPSRPSRSGTRTRSSP